MFASTALHSIDDDARASPPPLLLLLQEERLFFSHEFDTFVLAAGTNGVNSTLLKRISERASYYRTRNFFFFFFFPTRVFYASWPDGDGFELPRKKNNTMELHREMKNAEF